MQHFTTLRDYCKAIGIPAPRHDQFDIRSFEANMATVVHQMPPFRHAFYAIALKVGGQGKAVSSHYSDFPEGSVIFFNSPFQIISWDIAPDWEGYYVMITQDFLTRHPIFKSILDDFPFLKIEKAIPFTLKEEDVPTILDIYQKIEKEYNGDRSDKFDFIAAYVYLLLTHIHRAFKEQVPNEEAEQQIRMADLKLLSRYQALIETHFRENGKGGVWNNVHSTSFYADLLHVHPNYLNAVVKSITGRTALQAIHHHILHQAKTYLLQTNMSIKEIAYQLHFDAPNNFNNFFKKQTQETPGNFRKASRL